MILPCFRLPASYFSVRFVHFWPEHIAAAWCNQKSCAVAFTCVHLNAFCCLSLLFYLWAGIAGFLALQEVYKITTWTQLARLISSLFLSVEQHLCWLNTCWVFFSLPKLLLSLAGLFGSWKSRQNHVSSCLVNYSNHVLRNPSYFSPNYRRYFACQFLHIFFSCRVACVCVHLSEFSFSILCCFVTFWPCILRATRRNTTQGGWNTLVCLLLAGLSVWCIH